MATRNSKGSITKTNRRHKKQKDPQKKHCYGKVSKKNYWRTETYLTAPASTLFLMLIRTHICLVCIKDPYLTDIEHLLVYTSEILKREKHKKYSTEHTTEYQSKRNSIVKPWGVSKNTDKSLFFLSKLQIRI